MFVVFVIRYPHYGELSRVRFLLNKVLSYP